MSAIFAAITREHIMPNHGVIGASDPNFKPDPNIQHVYDEKKGVYRLVKPATKPEDKRNK